MYQFRKILKNKITIYFLASLLLAVSCQKSNTEFTQSLNPQISGQDVFEAVYFNKGELATKIYNGELASLIPEDGLNEEKLIKKEYIQEQLVLAIIEQNPDFMNHFKTEVFSKDPVRIKAILFEGGHLISTTMNNVKLNNEIYASFTDSELGGSDILSEVEQEACLMYLVAVVAIAVYALVYFWEVSPRGQLAADKNELYIDQIAYNIYEL